RCVCVCSLMLAPPPRSTLFPYTTLFRSADTYVSSSVSSTSTSTSGSAARRVVAGRDAARAAVRGFLLVLVVLRVVATARAPSHRAARAKGGGGRAGPAPTVTPGGVVGPSTRLQDPVYASVSGTRSKW